MSREKNCPSYSQDNIESAIMHYILSNGQTDKVAKAEKPHGKYKMPEMNLDSFDWDLWLREKDPNYQTLEEEDKLVSQPSIDESNATWWDNMYYDYKKSKML